MKLAGCIKDIENFHKTGRMSCPRHLQQVCVPPSLITEYVLCVVEEVHLQNVLKTLNELCSSFTYNGLYLVCVVEDVNLQNVPHTSKSS